MNLDEDQSLVYQKLFHFSAIFLEQPKNETREVEKIFPLRTLIDIQIQTCEHISDPMKFTNTITSV